MDDTEASATLNVGDRIVVGSDKATIKFIGHLQISKGLWIGVEWDDVTRGNHDGLDYGIKLSSHPKGGSFLRPRKIQKGQSVCAALLDRYGDPGENPTEEELSIGQGAGQQLIEMVGFDKVNKVQSQLDQLRQASVFDSRVSCVESETSLQQLAPNIQALDLSRNLLSAWRMVARIVSQLRQLRTLNLSENKIPAADDEEKAQSLSNSFEALQTLMLNRMDYTWEEILKCSAMWPSLKELHVCFNRISHLSNPFGSNLKNLCLLNVEGNKLSGWDDILKIGHLPNLQVLIANGCNLQTISIPDCGHGEKSKIFTNLKEIALSHNFISAWEDVSELDKLCCVQELRFTHNPVLQGMSMASARQQFLARIANLQMVNRTPVEAIEQQGAEVDYLKMYGQEWKKAGGNQDPSLSKPSAVFAKKHPRYEALITKWGPPEDSEMKKEAVVLKDSLLELIIRSPTGKELKKKLPGTMTVEKLRSLVLRLLKADASSLKLTYQSAKNPEAPTIELDNEMRLLSFYSIESGDTLVASW